MTNSLAERLMAKVDVKPAGCWNWTGSLRKGYGQIWTSLDARGRRQMLGAHRASYELARGKIADGLDLDHLCRNTRCVNPDHLEPVTRQVNLLRGMGPTAANARKVACDCGTELVRDTRRVKRFCPACNPIGGRLLTLTCDVCEQTFTARRSGARCCSNSCRRVARLAKVG